RGMIGRIKADMTVETLLNEIQGIAREPFPPIFRLEVLKRLAKPVTILAGRENAGNFAPLADILEKSTLRHHWLCIASPGYEGESRKAQAIVKDIVAKSNHIRNYMLGVKLKEAAMNRFPVWTGFADMENTGRLNFILAGTPRETWVLRNRENPEIIITREEMEGGSVMTYSDHDSYLPGEPLFAPSGTMTTWEVLERFNSEFGTLSKGVEMDWPVTWPVNIRQPFL
ncbi:MAG: hypothetical protein HQK66_15325, partial [Desulfamplus sp.]|nr:hypothetical protein [Desulfamplus sp.]